MGTQGIAENHDTALVSPMKPISKWRNGCIVVSLLLGLAVLFVGGFIWFIFSAVADCGWSGNVFTWIDVNADGIFQPGEPPLPGVSLHVNDILNNYTDVGMGTTNWNGESELRIFLPGCPKTKFEVKPDAPTGYRITTTETGYSDDRQHDRIFQFGFTYLPGVPTATPRPNPPRCAIIPEFEGHSVSSITSDMNNNLWVSAQEVAKLNLSSNEWTLYDRKAYQGWPQNILVSPDGSVWLIANENNPKWSPQTARDSDEPVFLSFIYQLVDGQWHEFSPDILDHKEIESITWAPDGSLWFSTWGNGAFNWNPRMDAWSSDMTLKFVYEIMFAKDGKQFNIEELGGGAIAPDGKVWGVSRVGYDGIWEGYYYDPDTKQITKSAITAIQNSEFLCYSDMKIDSQGGMWLATCEDGLLYIFDPINGGRETWQEYHSDIGFPTNEILDIYLEQDSIIWVGTKEGLARCQIETR